MKKKNILNKIIVIFLICISVIEIGMTIAYYMLINIDFTNYNNEYNVQILNN